MQQLRHLTPMHKLKMQNQKSPRMFQMFQPTPTPQRTCPMLPVKSPRMSLRKLPIPLTQMPTRILARQKLWILQKRLKKQ